MANIQETSGQEISGNDTNDLLIKPYKIERVCEPRPDIDQLVLKPVDNKESVYTRTIIKLKDAGLPTSQYASEFGGPGRLGENAYPWDLFVMLRYREDWEPSGYGLGDLIYAISLLPNEELTLEFKTWETSKTQQDVTDTTDLRNVSDIKSSQSSSSEVTNEDQSKTKQYVDAKAGYSGFGFSASVDAGWSEDISSLNRNIAKQARDGSRQATNEYKAARQVKVAVSRESGSEQKTTRKIKNINQLHTLNFNYYQVLHEYTITLHLYDVSLVILGKAPYLDVPFYLNGTKNMTTTIKEMIGASQSAQSVEEFVGRYGVSPVLTLRQLWSQVLWEGALATREEIQYPKDDKDRTDFQNNMLKFVRPTTGWVEPDNSGLLRWAYEILPEQVEKCLSYLYKFVPYDIRQFAGVLVKNGFSSEAANNALLSRKAGEAVRMEIVPQQVEKKILVPGPFYDMPIKDYIDKQLPAWVRSVVGEFEVAQANVGIVNVEGEQNWKVTLPTQGVYADLSLGICSGGEDYYEVQRQFDLELKRLEIKKLELEVERLKLENERFEQDKPASSLTITSPPEQSSLNVNLTPAKGDTQVKFD
jgi:hypothetical protein